MSTELVKSISGGVKTLKRYLKTHEINEMDERRNIPIHIAAMVNNGTLEYLIEHGADVNVQDCGGETALHRAVAMHEIANVVILLSAGAKTDLYITESTSSWVSAGSTPLDAAKGWRSYAEWAGDSTDELDKIIDIIKVHEEKIRLESSVSEAKQSTNKTKI